ncbi:neutral/alkaline non-lysosomal ceramidase N-terminal domain-containing protein [Thermoanaerobacterium thermosaccharolyticum]|uniref:neutral/alkaline non-lysosomal ceramidase N-terminal domain-containing protein n=1 Tax=Thermoanaerobacterium thermosaccharolyticum TaxID=1517 RepID=UPI001238F524|nr:neutral/alkaline non-lysosomal ceramidase N-terminal domain-containing protein [Thermoanaerobacterium thermosaccharolyticum]KAA5806025.1 hypothetical protein F1655_11190 [Thermoanaerobacterium thermosaccharolyticum]
MLEVGISTLDITPLVPQYMAGYVMRTEKSKGVHKDLTVTALTLSLNQQMLILISADIIAVDEKMSQAVRETLSKKYSLSEKMISVGALHTHSAPIVNEALDEKGQLDKEYRLHIINQMIKAASNSVNNLQRTDQVIYRYGRIDGLYGNRNDKSDDGDKWVHIIDFKNKGCLLASIVNFSCHGTVLGPDNYYISADLPGEIRRRIKEKTGISPILLNGNAGDMSNRQYRQGNDLRELDRIGNEICKQIFAFNKEIEIYIDELCCDEVKQEIKYRMDKEKIKNLIAQSEEKLKIEQNYDKRKLLKSGIAFLQQRLNKDKLDVDINITSLIYKLGDLAIVTIPGELFSKLGLKLKNESEYKPTLIFGYANDFNGGYLVSEEDYGDSYESVTSEIPKGKPEELIAEITKHLRK